ncbi:mechanosensitive ion channel domain-containing protein [Chitinivorax sp. PXF-14]|uniref:mechanosensitive ion channel family protein n=1 Tax=Chitinivorax sp. PXF-14 TaxID=3230488 RepID=UPI0034657C93
MENDQIHNLIADAIDDLQHVAVLWQIGVIVASLGLAWVLSRAIRGWFRSDQPGWEVGAAGINRALFPITALMFVLLGRSVLSHFFSVKILKVAVPLLLSMAAIRVAVYMLRYIFPQGRLVARFERYIGIVVWAALALHIMGWLPEVLSALDDLGFSVGRHRVSLLIILSSILWFSLTLLSAMWLGSFIEQRVMQASDLDLNMRVVLTKIIRALLIVVGVMVALPLVGIDITMLSVFSGAFGVGLGLGLQKIASNYVSGFVILLDRSIRPGDFVVIDNRAGNITRLTARYVVVKGLDGSEAIIPNETLVTQTVVNRSYTDRNTAVDMVVQVAYESDLRQVQQIMLDAIRGEPRVLAQPGPSVCLETFADSGVNMKAVFWIKDPENGQLGLKSNINFKIWDAFKQAGIEIPYPRRDIQLLNAAELTQVNAR